MMSVYSWINHRNIGCHSAFGEKGIYQKFLPWDAVSMQRMLWQCLYRKNGDVGCNSYVGYNGVFGLKYSPDGKVVVAACEKDAVVIIDPLTSKTVCKKENVHTMRCNTVTFIDDRLFATCSDDTNISVWDIRNMKENVLHLKGHSGWVKNVEFHKPSQQLVSAAFDDTIMSWNLNDSSNGECASKVLMKCTNLMRMRLSSDGNSMYISSIQTADLIAIHNLELDMLPNDVDEVRALGRYADFSDPSIQFRNGILAVNCNDRYNKQSQPIMSQNHVELYYGYSDDEQDDSTILCQSIDVHPDNMAIVMRYDRLPGRNSKFLSVHNTWSFFGGPDDGNNSWASTQQKGRLPMPRGQATNKIIVDGPENTEYLQEVSFSPCGKLIASPSGFGIRIVAFDARMSDYRSHIESRVGQIHQWEGGGDEVLPAYVDVGTSELHGVVYCFGHRSITLSTAFSPTHMQIATGSKNGQIILFEPVL